VGEDEADADVTALLLDYESTAVAWDAASWGEPTAANRLFDHLHDLFKQLRETEQGRHGIAKLMNHEKTGVRLQAAAHSLRWEPAEATKVLEEIDSGPGLHGISAKYTLKAFRDGTLNQDW
jgi:hypothetical protein